MMHGTAGAIKYDRLLGAIARERDSRGGGLEVTGCAADGWVGVAVRTDSTTRCRNGYHRYI